MQTRKLKIEPLTRAMQAGEFRSADDVYEFPFSSEAPADQWFGTEVLRHEADAVDLSRLNDAAPLLWNHDRDCQIGVIESTYIGPDRRGYCRVRFGTSERAQEIRDDVDAGIIRNVSTGYRINKMIEQVEEGRSTFTATRWTPYEVSFVSIPADRSVGMGRGDADLSPRDVEIEVRGQSPATEEAPMTVAAPAAPAAPAVDTAAIAADAAQAERARIAAINDYGTRFDRADLARQLIEGGRSIEDARAAFLEAMGARQVAVGTTASGSVDLSEKEVREYSVVRAITAALSKNWDSAGLELEVSRTLAKQSGRETEGFFMPTNLRLDAERATYAVGAPTTGGNLVATQLLAGSFIDILRNNSAVMPLGVTMLTGLTGNIAIPRQTSATQTFWVTENTVITQDEALFDQITMSPKQLGARSQYSRLMLQQATPDIEALVRADLAAVMALGIDRAAVSGTGASGQPRGILNTPGIGSVAMGTNGAALTNLDPVIDCERAVDIGNALNGSLYYLTNARVVAMLKKLKDTTGMQLWTSDRNNNTTGTAGNINGFPIARSNQIPSNLVKGTSGAVCSALLFGDFSQFVVGMWGGLEILPNPYGAGYNSGAVDIRAMQTVDMNVRQPVAFSAITDILAG